MPSFRLYNATIFLQKTGSHRFTFVCNRKTAKHDDAIQLTNRFVNRSFEKNRSRKTEANITIGFM